MSLQLFNNDSYINILNGFSRYDLNTFSHSAPTAPSTTRWSQLRVTLIMGAELYLIKWVWSYNTLLIN